MHCTIQFHPYKLSTCLGDSMLVALFHCREGGTCHWIMVIFPHPLSQVWWSEKFRKLQLLAFSVLLKGGVSLVEWFKFQLLGGMNGGCYPWSRSSGNFSFRRLCYELRENLVPTYCEKILRLLDLDYDFSRSLMKQNWLNEITNIEKSSLI